MSKFQNVLDTTEISADVEFLLIVYISYCFQCWLIKLSNITSNCIQTILRDNKKTVENKKKDTHVLKWEH